MLPRMVKILETAETLELAMIDGSHEKQPVDASSGVHDRVGKPRIAAAERVLGRREPDIAKPSAEAVETDQS